jgi:hypothetical protein
MLFSPLIDYFLGPKKNRNIKRTSLPARNTHLVAKEQSKPICLGRSGVHISQLGSIHHKGTNYHTTCGLSLESHNRGDTDIGATPYRGCWVRIKQHLLQAGHLQKAGLGRESVIAVLVQSTLD